MFYPVSETEMQNKKNGHELKSQFGPTLKVRNNVVVRLFGGVYFRFCTHWIKKWMIVLVNLGILIMFIIFAVRIDVSREKASTLLFLLK